MHEYLRHTIEGFLEYFKQDEHCLCVLLHGSAGTGRDDIYSDVDLSIIVTEDSYKEMKDKLPELSEKICGKIHLWFPEGERANHVNHAFLFEAEGEQFLYDLAVMTQSFYTTKGYDPSEVILFDRTGTIQDIRDKQPRRGIQRETIPNLIKQYWLYTYLTGKYYRRADLYKLIYIQHFLFDKHMMLLGALYPNTGWTWWPVDLMKLSKEDQMNMLIYLRNIEMESIAADIMEEISVFSRDAKRICERFDFKYPHELEKYVRKHLYCMGFKP